MNLIITTDSENFSGKVSHYRRERVNQINRNTTDLTDGCLYISKLHLFEIRPMMCRHDFRLFLTYQVTRLHTVCVIAIGALSIVVYCLSAIEKIFSSTSNMGTLVAVNSVQYDNF